MFSLYLDPFLAHDMTMEENGVMSSAGKSFESTIVPRKQARSGQSPVVPALTVITHPNPSRMGDLVLLHGLGKGKTVEISRVAPLFQPPGKVLGTPLSDPFISREPILLRVENGVIYIDPGSGKIPLQLGGLQVNEATSFPQDWLDRGVVLVLAERVILLLHWINENIRTSRNDHGLVGYSDKIRFLRGEIDRVGDLPTPVLLSGASGTGKELVAQAIHQSSRSGKPFISVNMGAITPSLAAAELFGAVRGSFTGSSRDQTGYFKAAHRGTLFLDEIGETGPEVQVMLLRALETGEISPVGAQSSVKVETRLITATDADLEAKMAEDSFKTPLFHRLAGYEINLPRLTERLEDFGRLFFHFAHQELGQLGALHRLKPQGLHEEAWLPASLMARLLDYAWPGNVRQLRNTVRQLLIGCRGEPVLHLTPKLVNMLEKNGDTKNDESNAEPKPFRVKKKNKPSSIGSEELITALREEIWDIKSAAERLGISRGALYLLIEKTPGLQKASELDPAEIRTSLEEEDGDVRAAANKLRVSVRALRRRMKSLGLN